MYKERVLAVDEGWESRQNLRFLLHLAGVQQFDIISNEEAFNLFAQTQDAERPFDILLLRHTETSTGFTTLLETAAGQYEHLPIVVLTNNPNIHNPQWLQIQSEMFFYCKPSQLLSLLGELILHVASGGIATGISDRSIFTRKLVSKTPKLATADIVAAITMTESATNIDITSGCRITQIGKGKENNEMTEVLNMANEPESTESDSMQGKYLTFMLADEGYGLEIRDVTEIIGIQSVTNVPGMPKHVKGVLNLRGKVIPVIDIRLRFHLPGRDYDERTCIIVVDVDDRSVGLVVDKVSEVIDIPLEDIEPAPLSGSKSGNVYIRGMGKIEQQVKILLDIERLIIDENLSEAEIEAEAV